MNRVPPKKVRSETVPLDRNRGMVLIIVLVVIVLLSLGAYTFSEFMVIETKAAALNGRLTQARALADSGVEFVSVILGNRQDLSTTDLYHNPTLFQGHLLINSTQPAGRGRFSVVSSVEGDVTARNIRFGLQDESSKLNLNAVAALTPAEDPMATAESSTSSTGSSSGSSSSSTTTEEGDTGLINPLMGLPGMTQEISEAIFDWIDEDDDSRTMGAESDYYQQLSPPYECKNGPLETLDELLLIRGITPQILFGEDANRNGLLDPNENDGPLTAPPDNADGILDRGWSSYLTVYSRELNLQSDRTKKIDLSSNTLSDVYDQLEDTFSEDVAKFVIAYRLFGPLPEDQAADTQATTSGDSQSTGRGPLAGLQAAAQAAGAALAGRSGNVTRGGMDLTNGGKVKINSVYDLIGVKVQGQIDGTNQTIESPWSADLGAIPSYMPELLDKLSVTGTDQYVEGRININQAHREVLIGLPNMTEALAQQIVGSQLRGPNGEPMSDSDNSRTTAMWLLTKGIVDLPTMRKLDPYVTGRGDVFRMQILGHFDDGGAVVRIEAVVDATQNPPAALFFRDLTPLGRGYSLPTSNQQ